MKHLLPILLLMITAAALPAQYAVDLYVAADGSAEFTRIQDAIDATKAFPDERITIHIKAGVYEEQVEVHAWNNRLTLAGAHADSTIIRFGAYFDSIGRGRNSTFHTPTLRVRGDDFRATGLTVANTAGPVGQAIAVAVEADRAEFHRCRFLGHQDTLYADEANTRQYYRECYIEGTTDFIFGAATALFENCTLHSKADSYITAASTPPGRDYGFVFLNCRLTADPAVTAVYLGRPWRSNARTVFLHSELGAHILPAGWDNWNDPAREATVFYAEYGNTGPGAAAGARVPWSRQLSPREARRYRKSEILKPFALPPMAD
ncbi:pectinesterase [Lewinella marina]|uniref:Pectinesterase n=1 Tax=Neolewinella marina TaxID=438751 RepID=A0A2G0CIV5_9BACT|nr:pectinesterase family protein [Neolewinella marina]NJB84993.1 pectinesterase [Neolewinella marina]PHK99857.1 pectin esterase [Neolewinella marina]